MNAKGVNFELLFDAEAYRRSGHFPWTFFAYPTTVATQRGLPPDDDACRLLAEFQQRQIDVAIWTASTFSDRTTYYACRYEDRHRLEEALQELQQDGIFPPNFCASRSEALFGQVDRNNNHEN